MLTSQSGNYLAERFRRSPTRHPSSRPPRPLAQGVVPDLPVAHGQSFGSQLRTLARRYLAVIRADRALLALIGLLPVVLALIAHVVPAENGLRRVSPQGPVPTGNADARQLLLVLVISAALWGWPARCWAW